ncbi:hypothetical protein HYFRA_00000632 [Hymenoscyphus fraxineus]|uniref:Uncharacterized protein n=1 Tax=Hymenoscyphus fraxineus TaxID=746836 RepID=A0A9N9L669_9HELO|nr:hypothetical protein HYFRA_00000632 [Hymenoscyphus fraxineus]
MAGQVPPLVMSNTKDDLLKALKMAPETYTMMAKEADNVYRWLTQGGYHLKDNCSRRPPYDWSDIREKSKNEAYERIAQSGDAHTSYYWNLAAPTEDCSNWIARWFLYHKFRYRDGRNRNSAKDDGSKSSRSKGSSSRPTRTSGHPSSRHPRTEQSSVTQANGTYYEAQNSYYTTSANTYQQQYYTQQASSSTNYSSYGDNYAYDHRGGYDREFKEEGEQSPKTYYDPVRDADSMKR